MKNFLVLSVLVVAVLSGCATINSHELNGSNLQGGIVQRSENCPSQEVQVVSEEEGGSKKVLLPTDPYHTLGILKTEAMAKGRVTIVAGVIPDIRFGEYFPGAIGGKCLAVLGEKEFFCQSILYRLGKDGQFRAAFIVEGLPDEVSSAKGMALSLKGDYAYDLSGKEFLLDAKFSKEGSERRKFILEKGTTVEKVPLVYGKGTLFDDPAILRDILSWNEYSTPEGILLSPSGKEEMNYIASINPQYKFIDKLIGTGNFSLKPDPIGVGVGLALDVFRAMNAPATGWDFSSQLPSRRQMGVIFQYVGSLRRAMSKNMSVASVISQPQSQPKKEFSPVKEKVVAENKIPTSTNILAEKISGLGFPKDIAFILAQKAEQKKMSGIVGIKNGTRVSAILMAGKFQGRTKLSWDENPEYIFKAEKYEAGGFSLYRVINNGREVLFRM